MSRAVHYILPALLLASLAAAPSVAQESITDVVKRVSPAVVTVITYDAKGEEDGQGSGFFVSPKHVITGWHVVDTASRIEVKSADGRVFKVRAVVAGSEDVDLAKLELVEANTSVRPLTVTGTTPAPGERVVVVGSPLGLEASISDGVVSGVRDVPTLGRVIQISAPISRGSSGSPVVNLNGEVVGIAQAIRGGGQNLNFAIPGSQVLALAPSGGRTFGTQPAQEGAGPTATTDELFEAGVMLFRAGAYDRALPLFLETSKRDPSNHLAWFLAGHCYINTGRYSEAAQAFSSSVRAKPDFVDGYCSMGAALGLMGQHDAALQAFNTALKIDPQSAIAHYGLGLTYLSLQQPERATAEYRILQTLDPELAGQLHELIP